MASEAEREAARPEVEAAKKKEWEDWVAIHEGKGFTVAGDGFHNARVLELPDGPTFDVEVS